MGAVRLASFAFCLLFGLYLAYLRFRLPEGSATRSGRWALSILAWLFILNAANYGHGIAVHPRPDIVARITSHTDMLTPNLAMAFGFIFPRLHGPTERLRLYLGGIVLLTVVQLIALAVTHAQMAAGALTAAEISLRGEIIISGGYALGWFVPIYLWLRRYSSETNPSARLLLTVAAWGFLFYPLVTRMWGFAGYLATDPTSGAGLTGLGLAVLFLLFVIIALIIRSLVRRRGHWGAAERVHLGFLAVCISFPAIWWLTVVAGISPAAGTDFVFWVITESPWTVVRPALLSVALLKIQIMAPGTPVDRDVAGLGSIVGGVLAGGFVGFGVYPYFGVGMALGIGGAVGSIAFLLAFPIMRRLTAQVMGVQRPEALRHDQALELYQLLMQMVAVRGRILDQSDETALASARERLRVSEREHTHFLTELRERAPVLLGKTEIRDLYLLRPDGSLLCRAGPPPKDAADREILEGTFSAIQAYIPVTHGAERRQATVRYGDQTLVLVTQEPFVIAASVDGPVGDMVESVLGEWLDLLRLKHKAEVLGGGTPGPAVTDQLATDLRRIFGWSKALLS